jgi:hypothetical protein
MVTIEQGTTKVSFKEIKPRRYGPFEILEKVQTEMTRLLKDLVYHYRYISQKENENKEELIGIQCGRSST